MKKINAQILREEWINFFKEKDHIYLPPKSLIPEDDNSLLFVNSGISAIKKYFLKKEKLEKNRIVNCQKVIRTNDIDVIGRTFRHHTFFEMLGNFSINSYFKEEAITWGYEFLTKRLKMNKEKLFFTVFNEDEEAYNLLKKLSIPDEKIIHCERDRNFWDMGSGPCGPCLEIYYDRGENFDSQNLGIELLKKDIENNRYLEIWNIVFSQFLNTDGKYSYSDLKNIDTGAGLERLLTVLEGCENNFENSLFLPIIRSIEKNTKYKYFLSTEKSSSDENKNFYFQVISDHLRASVMILSEGIGFGNKGRNYVLRKIFRRAMVFSRILDLNIDFLKESVDAVINVMSNFHLELKDKNNEIFNYIKNEANLFENILKKANVLIDELFSKKTTNIEKDVFILFERHGIPVDITKDILKTKNIKFSEEEYKKFFEEHQEFSKNKNFENPFKNKEFKGLLKKDQTIFHYDKDEIKEAKIIAIYDENLNEVEKNSNQKGFLLFDQSNFFPNTAGQLCDIGYVNDFEINNIIKADENYFLHEVNEGNFSVNQICNLKICKENRKLISSNHTSEHLMYGIFQKYIDSKIERVSGKKYDSYFSLSLKWHKQINEEEIIRCINVFEDVVLKGIDVETWFCNSDEAKNMNLNYEKLTKKNKKINKFRVVKIGEYTTELCIGTHLNNTKEIEKINVINFVKKGENTFEITCITTNKFVKIFLNQKLEDFLDKFKFNFEIETEEQKKIYDEKLMVEKSIKNDHYFLTQKKIEYLSNKIFEINKKLEKQKKEERIFELKKLINQQNEDEIIFASVQNYQMQDLYEFVKGYKLNNKNAIIFVLNQLNNKENFIIFGNHEKGQKILKYLKNNYSAKGGGQILISGSLVINNDKKEFEKKIRCL